MIHTNPDKEDIHDMRNDVLRICKELHIPILKTRCEKDGVWFYTKARPHKGVWLYHYGYEYFVAQGGKKLKLNIALMLRNLDNHQNYYFPVKEKSQIHITNDLTTAS